MSQSGLGVGTCLEKPKAHQPSSPSNRYDWSYYSEPVVVYWADEHNAGSAGYEALVERKIQAARDRMEATLSRDMLRGLDGTRFSETDFVPLMHHGVHGKVKFLQAEIPRRVSA